MGAPAMTAAPSLIGGWAVGPVVGRRPAGPLREAVEPITRRRAMFVLIDERFQPVTSPDPDSVIRAASVDHSGIAPMLDAGLLDDGTPWYVCDPLPGPVLDPAAGCSPRRALIIAEDVAQALTAMHADGVAHGLVGPLTVVPGNGRHGGEPTMLLDAGVAALVGSASAALASACGVSLPSDRGPAADVYALGALLLRLLTQAASPSAALTALPDDVRALLSSMLDPDPARRPTAGAAAARLAGLRTQVPATGVIPQVPAAAPASVPAPAPVSAPARALQGTPPAPESSAPRPVAAPRTTTSPFVVPRIAPEPAPTLRTGPLTVVADQFPRPLRTGAVPARRQRRPPVGRMLVAGGVIALAGLIVVVVTHLPSGQEAGVHAIAAGADVGAFGIGAGLAHGPASTSPASHRVVVPTTGPRTTAVVSAAIPSPAASSTPLFLRPVTAAAPIHDPRGSTATATSLPSPASSVSVVTTPSSTPLVVSKPIASTPASTVATTPDRSSTLPSSASSSDPSSGATDSQKSTLPAPSTAPDAPDPSTTPTVAPTDADSAAPSSSAAPTDDATAGTSTPDPTATP